MQNFNLSQLKAQSWLATCSRLLANERHRYIYTNFCRNLPAVSATNHKSCKHKPSRHVEMVATTSM